MTREDIIRMARGAGAVFPADGSWHCFDLNTHLERFAALVAAAEREECAKVAEAYEPRCEVCPRGVAEAIRARGEKK